MLVSWCHHVAVFPVNDVIWYVWFSVWLSAADPLTVSLMVFHEQLSRWGEQHVSVFCLRYLMVPNLRVFSCNQVFVGALQAYWKAASSGPHLSVSPPFVAFLYLVLLVSLAA